MAALVAGGRGAGLDSLSAINLKYSEIC